MLQVNEQINQDHQDTAMNRIYRSIWNQATGAYAAVSENVKSAGKRS